MHFQRKYSLQYAIYGLARSSYLCNRHRHLLWCITWNLAWVDLLSSQKLGTANFYCFGLLHCIMTPHLQLSVAKSIIYSDVMDSQNRSVCLVLFRVTIICQKVIPTTKEPFSFNLDELKLRFSSSLNTAEIHINWMLVFKSNRLLKVGNQALGLKVEKDTNRAATPWRQTDDGLPSTLFLKCKTRWTKRFLMTATLLRIHASLCGATSSGDLWPA